jgi:hypothetical protein
MMLNERTTVLIAGEQKTHRNRGEFGQRTKQAERLATMATKPTGQTVGAAGNLRVEPYTSYAAEVPSTG